MWKKIVPIAAVLILAWITLNLFSGSDTPEPDAVATDDSAVTEEAEANVVEATEPDSPVEEAETNVRKQQRLTLPKRLKERCGNSRG